jgi:hypothetical protein
MCQIEVIAAERGIKIILAIPPAPSVIRPPCDHVDQHGVFNAAVY